MSDNEIVNIMESADKELLLKMVADCFRRTIVHYGQWFSEVSHQLGMEKAMQIEESVWEASYSNQMNRLSKTLGFEMQNGIPSGISELSKSELLNLIEKMGINWLANDGIWFQAVENKYNMNDAKRCNDTCWGRFSPFEALRIKKLLNLPDNGGIPALKQALAFRLYAAINKQSIEDVSENSIIFRMNECRVQSARKRKGLDDYPCKSGGLVEYPAFAAAIDSRFTTECVGCPPDKHPEEWYCAWKFTLHND